MKLGDYLSSKGISFASFAEAIGTTAVTVSRYVSGQRRPEWDVLSRIATATEGAVTPNDFLAAEPPDIHRPSPRVRQGADLPKAAAS